MLVLSYLKKNILKGYCSSPPQKIIFDSLFMIKIFIGSKYDLLLTFLTLYTCMTFFLMQKKKIF